MITEEIASIIVKLGAGSLLFSISFLVFMVAWSVPKWGNEE